jgi:DNA-binding NtrC family response regulator
MTQQKATILLVEDEADFRERMQKAFGQEFNFINTHSIKGATTSVQKVPCDLILLDLTLENGIELEALNHISTLKTYRPHTPLIVVTKDQKSQTVVDAMRRGADDFVRKDEFDVNTWRKKFKKHINKAEAVAEQQNSKEEIAKGEGSSSDNFIGESPQIMEIKDKLRKLSGFPDVTVLITGETGVGKEVAARYLHQHGQRKDRPFKAVNLTAVTKDLMESELFGHKKGSFTHAVADKDGAFYLANGGVLLLDEIGEIDHNIQVKLLRFLDNKVITPVGGQDIQLDLQILAATNRDLSVAVEEGRFREDLYYRLNQYEIMIPPLRDRLVDLDLLIDHYLSVMQEPPTVLSPETRALLLEYSWPGNIRQLVNILKRLMVDKVMKSMKIITPDLLPADLRNPGPIRKGKEQFKAVAPKIQVSNEPDQEVIDELNAIEAALQKYMKKGDAANALGWNLDKLKYNILKYNEHYPDLVMKYPTICKKYKRFIK